jgi:hypothetical protein
VIDSLHITPYSLSVDGLDVHVKEEKKKKKKRQRRTR